MEPVWLVFKGKPKKETTNVGVRLFEKRPDGSVLFQGASFFSWAGGGGLKGNHEERHHFRGSTNQMLWMDEILHHFETMANHGCSVFTGKSNHSSVVNGFRPSAAFSFSATFLHHVWTSFFVPEGKNG